MPIFEARTLSRRSVVYNAARLTTVGVIASKLGLGDLTNALSDGNSHPDLKYKLTTPMVSFDLDPNKPYTGVMNYVDWTHPELWFGKDDISLLKLGGFAK